MSIIKEKISVEKMVLGAVMTALVIVFQLLGTFTAFFGPFSTAVALIPIIVGAAICGAGIGAWLGLVFGIVVLASGGAVFFMTYDVFGTYVTVLLKGVACGFAAGAVYKFVRRFANDVVAVVCASVVCPIVNTGVFLLGSYAFFMDDVALIAEALKVENSGIGVFWGLAMANFLIELGSCIVVSPIVDRLLKIRKA